MGSAVQIIVKARDEASGPLRGVTGSLQALGKVAAGAALTGIAGLGAGLGAAALSGLSFNNTLEQVTGRINAFTKDGALTAQILEDIKNEAAKTPFAFEAMAEATAALLPAAQASGAELMDLVGIAEVLAASNPAQGLEGAAYALRELVSGDLTSVIERFGIPRARLKELREEGVPDLEALQIAMKELGLDASLVSNLADTASGRWSTFKDTLQNVAATATAPIFQSLSDGLGELLPVLEANAPLFASIAARLGEMAAGALQQLVTDLLPRLTELWQALQAYGPQVVAATAAITNAVIAAVAPVAEAVARFVEWKDILIVLGVVIMSVVVPALVGAVVAALPLVATVAALVAGVALLRRAWETDWNGIQGKTAAVWEALRPIFSQIRNTLTVVLPQALTLLQIGWTRMWDGVTATVNRVRDAVASLIGLIQQAISLANTFSPGGAVQAGMNLVTGAAGRAAGGPVTGGTPYIVGERGPELIVPRQSGTVIPNHQLGGVFAGATIVINNDMDVEALAYRISRIQQERRR